MRNILCCLLFLSQICCFGIPFKNETFKNSIRTVFLENSNTEIDFPLLHLNSEEQLTLHFDEIAKTTNNFEYSFIKCTSSWELDDEVFSHDFIEGLETDFISDIHFSENTAIDYIHYSFSFPNQNSRFLLSGNYVVVVKDQETKEVVLTQKFYILDQKVNITPQPKNPVDFDYRYSHQIINFTVDHQLITSDNPINEFRAVVLQNGRYDNQKTDLRPQFIRGNQLLFWDDDQNLFEGGNEYRILDFRDLKLKGVGVSEIFYEDSIFHIIPNVDYKRAYLKYKSTFDHNGGYFIQQKPLTGDPNLVSDYAYVHFRLRRRIPLDSSTVFLTGAFTGNETKRDYQMVYRDSLEHYEAHVLMKQGVYDYAYAARKVGDSILKWEDTDGCHYQTENQYTILIYFQGFGDHTESLIGVKRFSYQ